MIARNAIITMLVVLALMCQRPAHAEPAVIIDAVVLAPHGVHGGALVSYVLALNDGVRTLELVPIAATIEHVQAVEPCIYSETTPNGWYCFFFSDAQTITVHMRVGVDAAPCGNAIGLGLTANAGKGSITLLTPFDAPGVCRSFLPLVHHGAE